MQQQTPNEPDHLNLEFVLDDFEIEGLDFKPVTKGLGFHGEKEKPNKPLLASHTKPRKPLNSSLDRSQSLQHTPQALPLSGVPSGLEAFYQTQAVPVQEQKEEKPAVKEMVYKTAKLSEQLISFIVDVFAIALGTILTFATFTWLVDFKISYDLVVQFMTKNYDFLMILSLLYFIVYFTLFESVGTLGKRLMNLETRPMNEHEKMNVISLFSRSFFCLIGLACLFIPAILDMHGKISRTRVVKKA